MAIFPTFFGGGKLGQENVFYVILERKDAFLGLKNKKFKNVFYDILDRKNSFLGYKNKKIKKSKNWHFSKGVNPWFWFKNGHFSNFFF